MNDLDPFAQTRVQEIEDGFRVPIPLGGGPAVGPLDQSGEDLRNEAAAFGETDTRKRDLPIREPITDPKRHPFEVYVTGYTNADQDHANVFVAWGTVLNSEADVTDVFAIAHKDDSFTLTNGDWIWLECVFDLDGTITSLDLKAGGTWPHYPALYFDAGASGNTWYQPIAQVRAMQTGKSSGHADSGEFPEIESGLKIAQLTNTHLVKKRECAGDDGLTRVWKLVPGPGGGL